MLKDRRIDPEIDENTKKFFNRLIWILVVINIVLGSLTAYDKFIYVPDTSIKVRYADELYPDEV
jgi:hypothetical protein